MGALAHDGKGGRNIRRGVERDHNVSMRPAKLLADVG